MSAASIINSKGKPATIERAAVSDGAAGGQGYTYATHLTSVMLFRQPTSGTENEKYGGVRGQTVAKFYALVGQDIKVEDRILLDGRYWDIEFADNFETGDSDANLEHMKIIAVETKGVPA